MLQCGGVHERRSQFKSRWILAGKRLASPVDRARRIDCEALGSFVAKWVIVYVCGFEIQTELSTRSLLIRPTNFLHQVHGIN